MRWTWIDRFVSFEPGRSAVAVKNLSLAEDHFADHFPGYPVMPASLILEGLAQAGGILVGHAHQFRDNVVLAKMTAKFHREAMAGEQLTYRVEIVDLAEGGSRVSGRAESGGQPIADVEIMFGHVTADQLPPGMRDTQFVFSGELSQLILSAESKVSPP